MTKHPLTSDFDEQELAELGDLDGLFEMLIHDETPQQDTEVLLDAITPLMPHTRPAQTVQYWLRIARAQLDLLDTNFWWTTLLLFGIGAVLSLIGDAAVPGIFALLSPLLAVVGVAYIFRPEAQSLLELEYFSQITSFELLLARTFLALLYNIVISLVLIIFAWSFASQIALTRLLLIWFGPMLGLSGLALYLTLRWNRIVGSVIPVALWVVMIGAGWRQVVRQSSIQPGLFDYVPRLTMQSDLLLGLSVIGLGFGLVMYILVLRTEHQGQLV